MHEACATAPPGQLAAAVVLRARIVTGRRVGVLNQVAGTHRNDATSQPHERAMSTSRQLRAVAVLTASAFVLACDDGPTDSSQTDFSSIEPGSVQLEIKTDKPVYSAAADSGATPILTNLGPDTVYAVMGEWVYLEELVNDEWTFAAVWFVREMRHLLPKEKRVSPPFELKP